MKNSSGQVIRGYELREKIGSGGFGEVYRAYQGNVGRDVALKIVLPQWANNPEFIRRFELEAQLVARLEHIHIVPLYDYWRDPNGAYLVMRWLRGGSVKKILQQHGPLQLDYAVKIMLQICSALSVAHRNGVIHRDIKPDNMLLDDDGNAFLTDFGIAKDLGSTAHISATQGLVGSPAYASPEQITGAQAVSEASDVYALGIVLYELLTGTHPFTEANLTQMIYKQLYEIIPAVSQARADLPDGLNAIIAQATAKEPVDRYEDVRAFAAALRKNHGQSATLELEQLVPNKTPVSQISDIDPINPYKGLRAFQEADAEDFFGRETLNEHLLKRLRDDLSNSRFIALVGPSGSGKSSVLKAGLLPAIRDGALPESDTWFIAEMVPGDHPMQKLEEALLSVATRRIDNLSDRLTSQPDGLHQVVKDILPGDELQMVLLIDQLEELFTNPIEEEERRFFLNSLAEAVTAPDSRLYLIAALSADYYDRPLLYPKFGALVRERTEIVLPLTPQELERAIVAPAERAGLYVEPRLVASIITDISQQPGALPLLQYSLTELFERRSGNTLTLDAYSSSGGVLGALARRADEIYGELSSEEKAVARQIFLRLVNIDTGADGRRRRVFRSELLAIQVSESVVDTILESFGRYRLLTFDHDPITREPTIEVAHQALINEWEQLKGWLNESRVGLQFQRQLSAVAHDWHNAGKDPSFLLRGSRLTQLEEWATTTDLLLTQVETDFLTTSIQTREEQESAERARQEHERQLEQQSQSRLRILVAVMALALLVAVGLSILAVSQSQQAAFERDNAIQARSTSDASEQIAREQAAIAQRRADTLQSLILTDNAQSVLETDPNLAFALALQAVRVENPPPKAQNLFFNLNYNIGIRNVFSQHQGNIRGLAISPDGSKVFSGDVTGKMLVWDAKDGTLLYQLDEAAEGHSDAITSVAYHQEYLVSASRDDSIIVWDANSYELVYRLLGHSDDVNFIAFHPTEALLISGSSDQTMILWDLTTGTMLKQFGVESGHEGRVLSAAFSPDGSLLASSSSDNMVLIWQVSDGAILQRLSGHTDWVMEVAFAGSADRVVSASEDGQVILWDVAAGTIVQTLRGHEEGVLGLAVSADGQSLATVSRDRKLLLWNLESAQMQHTYLGHVGAISRVSFSPDNRTVISGDSSGAIIVWDVGNEALRTFESAENSAPIASVDISSDGITAASGMANGSVHLWDIETGQLLRTFSGHTIAVNSVSFHPNQRNLASGSRDRQIIIWDIVTGRAVLTLTGHTDSVLSVSYNADGTLLASASADGTVRLWNSETGEAVTTLSGHTGNVRSVAFSPDGRFLASGGDDTTVLIWKLEDYSQVQQLRGHNRSIRSLAFFPDGKKLVSAGDDILIRIWNLENGEVAAVLSGHTNAVLGVDVSPDGQRIVSASFDTSVILWGAETGEVIHTYQDHRDFVSQVVFTGSGDFALSGSGDQRLLLWQVSLPNLIRWAEENRYIRDFSCEERLQYQLELCEAEVQDGSSGT